MSWFPGFVLQASGTINSSSMDSVRNPSPSYRLVPSACRLLVKHFTLHDGDQALRILEDDRSRNGLPSTSCTSASAPAYVHARERSPRRVAVVTRFPEREAEQVRAIAKILGVAPRADSTSSRNRRRAVCAERPAGPDRFRQPR
jgi:hypothetical protein